MSHVWVILLKRLVVSYKRTDEAATDVRNTMSTGVLGTARGQAAEAQTGMAQASRLATSDALTRARANQQTAMAKFDAGAGMALAAGMRGYDAFKEGGGFAGMKDRRQQRRGERFLADPLTSPQSNPITDPMYYNFNSGTTKGFIMAQGMYQQATEADKKSTKENGPGRHTEYR